MSSVDNCCPAVIDCPARKEGIIHAIDRNMFPRKKAPPFSLPVEQLNDQSELLIQDKYLIFGAFVSDLEVNMTNSPTENCEDF